jgi:hypothetical protein
MNPVSMRLLTLSKRRHPVAGVSSYQSHASKEEWERAWGEYRKNFEDGQLNKFAGQIAFFVDDPFKRKTDDKRKEIYNNIDCLTYTLEPTAQNTIDPQSATHLLQIIDHCHDLTKQDMERASAEKHPPASCVENEQNVCRFHWRKTQIWWLNKVLRCTIFERAVAICNDVAKTTWGVMPHVPSAYDMPQDAPDCIRDYHDDSHAGVRAKSEKFDVHNASRSSDHVVRVRRRACQGAHQRPNARNTRSASCRRVRGGADHESEDGSQPAHGRHDLGRFGRAA